MIFSVNDIPSR